MVVAVTMFAAGLLAWTFLEYAIHGWLSHRFVTFVTPLHQVHHRDPSAVFALGAWLPTAAIFGLLLIGFGMTPATIFVAGLVAGFAIYELVHYRLHFAPAVGRFEARLRARHLAHHLAMDDRCLGVTTALWDRIFGSAARPDDIAALAARLDQVEPIAGRSNLGRIVAGLRVSVKHHVSLSGGAK
ncbi:MAG TPA: sterol desaturase family protein [Candidatus Binataceae bacterium]|nr:sterol desaturase family protein [Candidatus Binataceae bacterium]